jgi:ABC-type uncharacterized transport system substrate-binding protein
MTLCINTAVLSFQLRGTLFVPSEVNSVCSKDELAKASLRAGMRLITMPVFSSAEVPIAAGSLVTQAPPTDKAISKCAYT